MKKSHLQSQKLLDWIGSMRTCSGPRASCALVGAHVSIHHGSTAKQSSVDVENTCWSQSHHLSPGCQARYGRNVGFL